MLRAAYGDKMNNPIIYFIRHGKTAWNAEGKYLGVTDEPLSEIGKNELRTIWNKKKISFQNLYISPMIRCVETANIIFPSKSYKIIDEIHERNFGIFEGKKYEELKNNKEYINFISSRGKCSLTNGESYEDFDKRINIGLTKILDNMNEQDIQKAAILCHGGVIMHIFSQNSGKSGDFFEYIVDNGRGYASELDLYDRKLKILEKI